MKQVLDAAIVFLKKGQYGKLYLLIVTTFILSTVSIVMMYYVGRVEHNFDKVIKASEELSQKTDSLIVAKSTTRHDYLVTSETMVSINGILNDMRATANADVAYVFLYHNGFHTIDNIQFMSATCMFEQPPQHDGFISQFGPIPVSVFAGLNTSGKYIYSSFESEQDTFLLNSLLLRQGYYKNYTVIPIHLEDGSGVRGVIGLNYRYRKAALEKEEESYLIEMGKTIRGLLYNVKRRTHQNKS